MGEFAGGVQVAFAFQQDVPINMDVYRTIVERLGENPPEGLIVHLVMEQERGLRYIDVWESAELHSRFVKERLHPIVRDVLLSVGFDQTSPEPAIVPIDVTDVWGVTLTANRPLTSAAV
jgi:hypothetical protein